MIYTLYGVLQKLESFLPARKAVEIPTGEHVEEVNMMPFDARSQNSSNARREAYDEDGDEEQGGPRVQCAQQ